MLETSEKTTIGSNALSPQAQVKISTLHPPAPGELAHVPAGDPERAWRRRDRWIEAATATDAAPVTLARHDAAALLDAFLAVAEWGTMALCPEVRAMAVRMIKAGEAVARGDADEDGRATPIGRILGLQPPAGSTAAHRVKLIRRDAMLRHVRNAVPRFQAAPPRAAAAAMVESFERYCAGGWQADQRRESAPVPEPSATWWRVLRLGLKVPVPKADRLADILSK